MDLILEKHDILKTATTTWTNKLMPAIIRYSETLTGRSAAAVMLAQRKYAGMFFAVTVQ